VVRRLEINTPIVDERENRPSSIKNGKNKKLQENHDHVVIWIKNYIAAV